MTESEQENLAKHCLEGAVPTMAFGHCPQRAAINALRVVRAPENAQPGQPNQPCYHGLQRQHTASHTPSTQGEQPGTEVADLSSQKASTLSTEAAPPPQQPGAEIGDLGSPLLGAEAKEGGE